MRLVVIAIVLLTSSLARADKVAVFDSDRLYVKGGIARWLAVRAKLDEDRKKFKLVESPDGKAPKPVLGSCDAPLMGEDYCKKMRKLESEMQTDAAWSQIESAALDPITKEVDAAIQAFAKRNRIDVLFEREETMIYVAPGADITDAFIKDFNAKSPPVKPKAK